MSYNLFEQDYRAAISSGGPQTPDAESLAIWKSWANYHASAWRPSMSGLYHLCRLEILIRNERHAALDAPLLTAPSRRRFVRLIRSLDGDMVRACRLGGA
jgi:hypothetical protein